MTIFRHADNIRSLLMFALEACVNQSLHCMQSSSKTLQGTKRVVCWGPNHQVQVIHAQTAGAAAAAAADDDLCWREHNAKDSVAEGKCGAGLMHWQPAILVHCWRHAWALHYPPELRQGLAAARRAALQ